MTPPSLWLAAPSRYAALSRPRARAMLAMLAAWLVLALTALAAPAPPAVSPDAGVAARADDRADVILYEGVVEALRHGGNYYTVAADALRTGNYPLRPFVTFRLPTLAVVEAMMPPAMALALLYALALGVLVAWAGRLRAVFARHPPRLVALVLVAGGMAAMVGRDLVAFHDVWGGLFIALSLAWWQRAHWTSAVTLALVAMLIRETAALYALVMLASALRERAWREAAGWGAALAALATVLGFHAYAVAGVVNPLDPASPGWAGLLGPGFALSAMTLTTALRVAPFTLGVLLTALALWGWTAWRDPLAVRVAATLAAYGAMLAVVGRVDTFYWALLVAPVIPLGLVFVPDALRDVMRAGFDRRRITVTRTERSGVAR